MLYRQASNDPKIMSCAPMFAGTGAPIQHLFDHLGSSGDLSAFSDDSLSVTKNPAVAILKMAERSLTTEKFIHDIFLDETVARRLRYLRETLL